MLGRRKITVRAIRKLGPRLGLNPKELARYCEKAEVRSLESGDEYTALVHDHFQMISDWYHFAILELVTTATFRAEIKWIARVLGISVAETRAAVARLERLGFLKIDAKAGWQLIGPKDTTTLGTELTSAALRKMQKQILEKAIIAVDEVPAHQRDQSAMTMAIDSARLPEAKERITKFRRELSRFLESGATRDHVYQLSISLFPLTRSENGQGKE